MLSVELIEKFWNNSRINTADPNVCWEWNNKRRPAGYGMFYFRGKWFSAHRISFQIVKGDIPDGLFVCHSCDNKSCINPAHLFLGTNRDNILDAVKKGIHGKNLHRGTRHYRSLVQETDIILIRRLAAKRFSHGQIADLFDMTRRNVTKIVNRANWKHI